MKLLCGIAVAVALGVAGCGGEHETPLLRDKSIRVDTTLTPDVHLFAERVEATVEVVVDRSKIDPASLRLETAFSPYEPVGPMSVERRDFGAYSRVRYETTLRCLEADCIPRTRAGDVTVSQVSTGIPQFVQGQTRALRRTYKFPAARVLGKSETATKARELATAEWRPLLSISRINWSDPEMTRQGFPFQPAVTPVQTPSYSASPNLLGLLLLVGALALVITAVRVGRRRRPELSTEQDVLAPELTPLERALDVATRASGRPVGERREALEALAFELSAVGRDEDAGTSRELAWSARAPGPAAMERLVNDLRSGSDARA